MKGEDRNWIGEILKLNSCLQELNLKYNNIGSEGGVSIGEALKVNRCLQQLDLYGNSIGVEGCVSIGEALKVNLCISCQ